MWYEFQRKYGRRLHIVAETGVRGWGCTNTGFLKALFGNKALVMEDYFISGPDFPIITFHLLFCESSESKMQTSCLIAKHPTVHFPTSLCSYVSQVQLSKSETGLDTAQSSNHRDDVPTVLLARAL